MMSPLDSNIQIETLQADRFAPFGSVVEAGHAIAQASINDGRAVRFELPVHIDASMHGGQPRLSIFRAEPTPLPWRIASMERHPWGSQTFVPLAQLPYLVLVGLGHDAPSRSTLRCFLARPNQGVHYARGTWHHSLLALQAQSDFLVIDRAAEPQRSNCDECATLDWQLWINLLPDGSTP